MLPPINFPKWIAENAHKLKPPVSNFCLYNEKDFTVMALGGPNARNDFHVNQTEEWFYQYKGSMDLKIHDSDSRSFKTITISQGDMFLLPGGIPHNPIRYADTIGIVIERKRPEGVLDELRWYCEGPEGCGEVVYSERFYCTDLGTQLKPVIEGYKASEEKRRCKNCGRLGE
ncbi:3-hydroxyanthranilic acid dioxygenase [Nowakowskiella sp. JEL0407]|nr:3-hydroxyanthranilic acid dioxygenase [Nowakowskiella sp. JEL0407]